MTNFSPDQSRAGEPQLPSRDGFLDISDIRQPQMILAALWNGIEHARGGSVFDLKAIMSYDEAGQILCRGMELSSVVLNQPGRYGTLTRTHEIPVQLSLEDTVVDVRAYDAKYGAGAAAAAIHQLRLDVAPVDIAGLRKEDLVAVLFSATRRCASEEVDWESISPQNAAYFIEQRRGDLSFDYLLGRPLKVNLEGDTFLPGAFDALNGQGAARDAVQSLRRSLDPIPLAGVDKRTLIAWMSGVGTKNLDELVSGPQEAVTFDTSSGPVTLNLSGETFDPYAYESVQGIGAAAWPVEKARAAAHRIPKI